MTRELEVVVDGLRIYRDHFGEVSVAISTSKIRLILTRDAVPMVAKVFAELAKGVDE